MNTKLLRIKKRASKIKESLKGSFLYGIPMDMNNIDMLLVSVEQMTLLNKYNKE